MNQAVTRYRVGHRQKSEGIETDVKVTDVKRVGGQVKVKMQRCTEAGGDVIRFTLGPAGIPDRWLFIRISPISPTGWVSVIRWGNTRKG